MIHSVTRTLNCFDEIDYTLILTVKKTYVDFSFKNDDQKIKELNKNQLNVFFSTVIFNSYVLLKNFLKDEAQLINSSEYFFKEVLTVDERFLQFLLNSNNLEKRIQGIKYINAYILFILQREKHDWVLNPTCFESLDSQLMRYLVIAKKKKLIEFLEKIDIYNLLFGENIHEAMLNNSSDILIFLYSNEKITFDQIRLLWTIAQDKHEVRGFKFL